MIRLIQGNKFDKTNDMFIQAPLLEPTMAVSSPLKENYLGAAGGQHKVGNVDQFIVNSHPKRGIFFFIFNSSWLLILEIVLGLY